MQGASPRVFDTVTREVFLPEKDPERLQLPAKLKARDRQTS